MGLNMEDITRSEIITALLFQAGGGLILGFATGYFLKKMVKMALIILGALTLGLLLLSYYDIISVNWNKLALLVERVISGTQALTASMQSWIIASIPFAGSFIAGLLLGFKYG
ncbi:MAG: FUN14 domain-containing protein [Acidilobaceae archaeon]